MVIGGLGRSFRLSVDIKERSVARRESITDGKEAVETRKDLGETCIGVGKGTSLAVFVNGRSGALSVKFVTSSVEHGIPARDDIEA